MNRHKNKIDRGPLPKHIKAKDPGPSHYTNVTY